MAIVIALSVGLVRFKVETRPEKVYISSARTIVIQTLYDTNSAAKPLQKTSMIVHVNLYIL